MKLKLKRIDLGLFIFGAIAVLPYIWPYYFETLFSSANGLLLNTFTYISYATTLLIALMYRKPLFELLKKSSTLIYWVLALFVLLLISTVVHSGKVSELWIILVRVVSFSLLLACGVAMPSRFLLKGILFIYYLFIVLSFIGVFFPFPGITGVRNFVSTKNMFLRCVFPGILIGAYLDFQKKGDISLMTYIFLGIVSFSVLMFRSSAGTLASFTVFALLIIRHFLPGKKMGFAKSRIFFIISLAIGILLIFLRQFTFYSDAVETLFGKDATFTGRSDLWNQAVSIIQKNPVIGIGHLSVEDGQIFGNAHWTSTSCHSLYLDVAVETGIIGLIILFVILILVTRKIDNSARTGMAQCFSILFFCYLISFNVEVFFNSGQYIYTFPVLFFLSFCFAIGKSRKRRLRFVWDKSV